MAIRFNDYMTTKDHIRYLQHCRAVDRGEAAAQEMIGMLPSSDRAMFQIEEHWEDARRPYYHVYSGIADSLSRLRLDIGTEHCRLPLPQLLVKFQEPSWNGVKSVLAANFKPMVKGVRLAERGLLLSFDVGEVVPGAPMPGGKPFGVKSYIRMPLIEGMTLENSLEVALTSNTLSDSEIEQAKLVIKLVVGVCLIGQDDPLVSPDVLAADKAKLTQDSAERLAEKARRRGKVGWVLGTEASEMSPHYRVPHMALRWTGEGRRVPKIVPVKGAVVHREKVKQVPTGFKDKDH